MIYQLCSNLEATLWTVHQYKFQADQQFKYLKKKTIEVFLKKQELHRNFRIELTFVFNEVQLCYTNKLDNVRPIWTRDTQQGLTDGEENTKKTRKTH